jgi:hypothetical protein
VNLALAVEQQVLVYHLTSFFYIPLNDSTVFCGFDTADRVQGSVDVSQALEMSTPLATQTYLVKSAF